MRNFAVAVYPGSFDPFTNGHLAVLKKACRIFDKVYVVIAVNSEKKRRYSEEEMHRLINEVIAENNLNAVAVICYDLVSETAINSGSRYIVRGIRNGTDLDYEETVAKVNYELASLETIYFRAGDLSHISSSTVMSVFKAGGDVQKWVPSLVLEFMKSLR